MSSKAETSHDILLQRNEDRLLDFARNDRTQKTVGALVQSLGRTFMNQSSAASIADPADVGSIDAIINAAYEVISGSAGKKRDWNRERSLFIPGARLMPTIKEPGGTVSDDKVGPQMLDVEGFIERSTSHFEKNGFFEKEIARRTEEFGHIAHVWSTYESRHNANDAEPFMRGINSIQLFYDGKRWWIVSIYWQHENPEDPIPGKYL